MPCIKGCCNPSASYFAVFSDRTYRRSVASWKATTGSSPSTICRASSTPVCHLRASSSQSARWIWAAVPRRSYFRRHRRCHRMQMQAQKKYAQARTQMIHAQIQTHCTKINSSKHPICHTVSTNSVNAYGTHGFRSMNSNKTATTTITTQPTESYGIHAQIQDSKSSIKTTHSSVRAIRHHVKNKFNV